MTTLNDLLRSNHRYLTSDFGPGDGEVIVDTGQGTVRPADGTDKAVMLKDVFKAGQYVSMDPHDGESERLRFVILDVNRDGLDALSFHGREGFLPWETMAAALRMSRQVQVNVLSDLENLDEHERGFVREQIGRLERAIQHHRTIADELSEQLEKLEAMGGRPGPHAL
jgi:hypothetical protein